MTLGEKIAKLRTEQHLSQGDLAEKMGVSRQSVSKWETGGSIPDLDKLVALSTLFSVSLDALVKEQAETPPVSAAPPVSVPPPAAFPPRKIAGWILLAVGLLCAILGLALNLILTVLGGYLGLCGIICLGVKRHPGLVIVWGTLLPCTYFLPWFTGCNLRMVFQPYAYQEGMDIQLIISYGFWALLFLLLFLTIRNTRMNRHPWLFSGWVIFSQIYEFVPIVFRYTEKIPGYYIALSCCAILFLIALLFFTGKALYSHFKAANGEK